MKQVALDRWMSEVHNLIEDTPLCELPLPGSHDAISYPVIATGSQTQSLTVLQQLEAGYRYFDFRVQVNQSVFYGVHGPEPTQHDFTAKEGKGNKPYVLDQIADFLRQPGHEQELVILCFSHFAAHIGQSFNEGDASDFLDLMGKHFTRRVKDEKFSMLVPRSSGPRATYGSCVNRADDRRQVVVIIDDDKNWYKNAAGTPAGDAERANALFFSTHAHVIDNYSDYRYNYRGGPAVDNLTGKIDATLEDQESRAVQTRDLTKFWITQAILNYWYEEVNGHSQNYMGAKEMNPRFTHIYERAWRRGYDSKGVGGFPKPNILLLDFVGEFDAFPEACVRMVSPETPMPPLQSGTRYKLLNNCRVNYLAAPVKSGSYFYAYTSPDAGEPHRIKLKSGSGAICSGDEIYILATINGEEAYLRTSSAASNDLYYEAGDHPENMHTWRILKQGAASGTPILEGDLVDLQSVDETTSMCPRGRLDYVSLASPASWMLEREPAPVGPPIIA